MKKIFLITSLMILILASCSDDKHEDDGWEWRELLEDVVPNPMAYYTPLENFHYTGSSNILGYGYDVTGKIASYESVRAQAIDIEKLQKEYEQHGGTYVGQLNLNAATSFQVTGANLREYLFNLTKKFAVRSHDHLYEDGMVYFAGTIIDNGLLEKFSEKHSYSSAHLIYEAVRTEMWFRDNSNQRGIVQPYFTEEFKEDIDHLAPSSLIKKYGTHIVRHYITGARFDMLYSSEVRSSKEQSNGSISLTNNDKNKAIKAGFQDTQSKTKIGFMHWENFDPDHEQQVQLNTNPILSIETHGGMPTLIPAGIYNLEKGYPDSNQEKWLESIDEENYSLILIKEPFPIYQLLEESPRREELKKAIDQYILERQVKE